MSRSLRAPWRALLATFALTLPLVHAEAASSAAPFSTLYAFTGRADGESPEGKLLFASDGNLYGTTYRINSSPTQLGTVYRLAADGTLTTLHQFTNEDGAMPAAGLVQAPDGYLYGTTSQGGAHHVGTIFRIALDGSGFQTLHDFAVRDGSHPYAELIVATDGDLYGTTHDGGANGRGEVFKVSTTGQLRVVHSFTGPEGQYPDAPLIQGSDGSFYGTTESGGNPTTLLYGTVFKMTAAGTILDLHRFQGQPDGAAPRAGLLLGTDGRLYGTTQGGGSANDGAVFGVATDGSGYRLMHSFTFAQGGSIPYAGLVEGSDGMLYGSTTSGTDGGQIFSIAPSGARYRVVHNFTSATDGVFPEATMIVGPDDRLYGTTGGDVSAVPSLGTVYAVTLAP